jgi:predicted enzyme related to lactoylglutathione lyase
MALQWFSLDVDSADPPTLARWWSEVLDYQVVWEEEAYVAIAKDDRTFPGIIFNRIAEAKNAKNRLHWDLNPSDQEAEVARLLELGATRVDIGQGEVPWAVMADPEGNEFCVITPWTHPDDVA